MQLAAVALVALAAQATAATSNAASSLTLLYRNNLNSSDDVNHRPALLLDAIAVTQAQSACQAVQETLLLQTTVQQHAADFWTNLKYLGYKGTHAVNQSYLLAQSITVAAGSSGLVFGKAAANAVLPVLCSQSSLDTSFSNPSINPAVKISLTAPNQNTYVGYRNIKSFRFLGIPYADTPARWTSSRVYSKTGQTLDATQYGSRCPQKFLTNGSEACLFLNIQTPYLPKAGSASSAPKLPVVFWIHGGGYTAGYGSDPGTDGGDLASREDVVVVSINYRLNALGFLAVPGQLAGNYGIGDQVTALQWVRQNIAAFGGDANKITIGGDSAGGGSCRVLVGSPVAHPLFRAAWIVSSPGGGDVNNASSYGYDYSHYSTISQVYNTAGRALFSQAGCNQNTVAAQIACLRNVPADTLANLPATGSLTKVVQDGVLVTTSRLDVSGPNNNTGHIPIVIGGEHNDGASFAYYPPPGTTSLVAGLAYGLAVPTAQAQRIINSNLFPYYSTGNTVSDIFNVTQRVATDSFFRCEAQATIYSGVASGAFARGYFFDTRRTWAGYDPNQVGNQTLPGARYPYYNLHSGGTPNYFGHPPQLRGIDEAISLRYTVGTFGSFVRTTDPKPPRDYLLARGYLDEVGLQDGYGSMTPVSSVNGPVERLGAFPPARGAFVDVPQCEFLGYPLGKYLTA